MDRSKLFAIIALVVGLASIVIFKEKPLPSEEDHDHDHEEPKAQVQNTPNFDVTGGITKLQTNDVRMGKGAIARPGDSVTVNYKGTLLNGKVFDQSYGKTPFDFQLGAGQVIKGWDQGVAGMRVGGKRQLTIPSSLAYGEKSVSGGIPANATLKFDVELLKVNGKE